MIRFISILLLALSCLASSTQAGTLTFDTYYHNDHLGSPVAATDERSDLLWRAHFRPYGERQENPADAAFGNVGYTGHMQDKDSGLIYMQQRYYDPLIGRFYSNDPVGVLGHMKRGNSVIGFNRYIYANNNPYKYRDPDGEFVQAIIGGAIGFASEVAVQTFIEGRSFGDLDARRLGQSTVIGALSGGVGGAAGKLAGHVISGMTKPASALGRGASRVATESVSGAVSGATAGASSSALSQLNESGRVDVGQIAESAAKGAVLGAVSGGVNGQFQANAAQKILGDSRAQTMFTSVQPGATAGNIAGNSVDAISSIADSVSGACRDRDC